MKKLIFFLAMFLPIGVVMAQDDNTEKLWYDTPAKIWLEALPQAAGWTKVVDGAHVRQLRSDFPGVYPEIFRYLPYFAKFDLRNAAGQPEVLKCLLKLKFPEAYALCYS